MLLDDHAVAPRVAVDLEVDPLRDPLGVLDGEVDGLVGDPPVGAHLR
jgi:hypothetical protein